MAKYTNTKPDWVPENADKNFATSVMSGIDGIKDLTVGNINPDLGKTGFRRNRMILDVEDYVKGVAAGDRMILSRAITLIESNRERARAR